MQDFPYLKATILDFKVGLRARFRIESIFGMQNAKNKCWDCTNI